jgi:hypothetical protein
MSDTTDLTVKEYEVFNNEYNALAFFLYHHTVLDQNATEGPFAFSIHDNSIFAGTAAHHVIFESVQQEIIDIARQRGVIMMMEFEGQQPVRCTPCYISEDF